MGHELTLQIGFTFAIIFAVLILYSIDRIPIELTSIVVLAILLVFFHFFPVFSPDGTRALTIRTLLLGFAEPALIAIIGLLVMGQALVQTGALDGPANLLVRIGRGNTAIVIGLGLVFAAALSGFLNDTPVVVMLIPIMSALAERINKPPSRLLIPLSYAAILGGMTTLIGTSTNLLVSGAAAKEGLSELGFFSFTVPGVVLAGIGLLYVLFIAPLLLPRRSFSDEHQAAETGRQFIAELALRRGNRLIGETAAAGMFRSLPDITVRLIRRGNETILPPFQDVELKADDVLTIAATRKALTELYSRDPDLLTDWNEALFRLLTGDVGRTRTTGKTLSEVVIAPASRLDGRTLPASGFHEETGLSVVGIRRQSRMARSSLSEIRLVAGDVMLVTGPQEGLRALRDNRDVLLLEWSTRDLPKRALANRAIAIFVLVVASAASGLLPIETAAVLGAGLMIISRCMNVRQAARAVDRRIIFLVATALALGAALNVTGGASYVAHSIIEGLATAGVPVILSAMFLLVAAMTNVLSNNATAVLFTPIAVSVARELGIDPMPFLLAVIFGANSCFATPIAYQTNLLVMGPGHYRFMDFVRVGLPLIILLWATFSLFIPWYYGLSWR